MSVGGTRRLTTLASFLRPVAIATLGESAATVARRLRDQRVGCLVVTRGGRPIGIVTDRDLTVRVVAAGLDPEKTRVDDIVTFDPIVLRESDTIDTASIYMRDHGIRRLPIVDDAGQVTGIVTADDLLVALGRQLACVGEALSEASDADESR